MTRDREMDAAQMSAPWSVRYCASRHPGEHILAKEQCADGCLGSRNCTQCRCRACPACMCYDPLGRLLQRDECGSSYKWRADVLLSASSAAGCRAACNRFAGRPNVGRPSVFAATCNTWTFGAADGACIGHVDSPLFVSGWEPHGVTHGVATCAAPSPPTEAPLLPAASPVALLSTVGSFACTDAVVRRMARAHDQCLRAGHFHSVVHISRAEGDKPNDEDVAASEALSAAVGPAAVSRIGLRELQAAFPHLLARMRGIKWSDKRRPFWLANGCDLPALAWFALHAQALPPATQHVWILQHDVGWTGQLPAILAAAGSTPQLAGADLVCDGPGYPGEGWVHFQERNHLDGSEVRTCLLPVMRLSRRLFHLLVVGLGEGNVSYCEMRAASACAAADWCRSAGLSATERWRGVNSLLGPFSHFTNFDERHLLPRDPGRPLGGTRNRSTGTHAPAHAEREFPADCDGQRGGSVGRLYHQVRNVWA